ncbi:MAG: GNAT family N-acetyltransferase [Cyanobacteria bacterium J06642_3]
MTNTELELINHLVEESLSQGFQFVSRLVREYNAGLNCFNKSGEMLLKASARGRIIGICGLNLDPYLKDSKIGRLRHLYVESAWRKQGVGLLLVTQLIHEAKQHYELLTLRTDTSAVHKFYQKLGFKTEPIIKHATHHLQLENV